MDASAGQSGRPKLGETDPNYDAYYEDMSDAELTREALERMFKNEDILARVGNDEVEDLKADLESEIDENPYLSHVKERYESMEYAEMSMLVKAATKESFNREEIAAFVDLALSIDFVAPDMYTVFSLEYLKLICAQMTSNQRVHLMAKLPVGVQEDTVGLMRKTGMVTREEVQSYANLVSEGSYNPAGEAAEIMAEVDLIESDIDRLIAQMPPEQKNYTTTHYDKPQSKMDRQYTVQNALKVSVLFVGIMTLIINTSGAARELLVERDPKAAIDHIMSHPYGPLSAVAIALTKRALDNNDRPASEILMTGERGRLRELIDAGVSRETIVSMKNQEAFIALSHDFESAKDVEDLRDMSFEDAFPKLSENLKSRGLTPSQHRKEEIKNEYIDLYLHLREWDYWSDDAAFKFADYCGKKYHKVALTEAYRISDELEEQKFSEPEEETT